MSYLVSDGLGPSLGSSFVKMFVNLVVVLRFDETGTVQNEKQCDILFRYWSVKKREVVVKFLKALFLTHAFGNDVAHHILQTLQEDEYQIPLSKFLNIGSDGLIVNKTIWNYLNEEKVRMGIPGLMQFIPCNNYTCCTQCIQGLSAYGSRAEELAIDLFYCFRHFPCKRWILGANVHQAHSV